VAYIAEGRFTSPLNENIPRESNRFKYALKNAFKKLALSERACVLRKRVQLYHFENRNEGLCLQPLTGNG